MHLWLGEDSRTDLISSTARDMTLSILRPSVRFASLGFGITMISITLERERERELDKTFLARRQRRFPTIASTARAMDARVA